MPTVARQNRKLVGPKPDRRVFFAGRALEESQVEADVGPRGEPAHRAAAGIEREPIGVEGEDVGGRIDPDVHVAGAAGDVRPQRITGPVARDGDDDVAHERDDVAAIDQAAARALEESRVVGEVGFDAEDARADVAGRRADDHAAVVGALIEIDEVGVDGELDAEKRRDEPVG